MSGEGRTALLCRNRGGKLIEAVEKRVDVNSTKAAVDFYANVKATSKNTLGLRQSNGTAVVNTKAFDVYVEVGPLKGPFFKINDVMPAACWTPS